MTTITIERSLLERLYLYWLEDADPHELDEFTAQVRAALSAPATAPEVTLQGQVSEPVIAPKDCLWSRNGHQCCPTSPQSSQPERKPMHEGEIQAAWLGQDLDEPIPYSFVLGIRSAERFNGIKEAP